MAPPWRASAAVLDLIELPSKLRDFLGPVFERGSSLQVFASGLEMFPFCKEELNEIESNTARIQMRAPANQRGLV